MRRVLLLAVTLLLVASPALAQAWDRYVNARFGFEVRLPPGFAPDGRPADNGDGLKFRNAAGTQGLSAWGGVVIEGDFEAHTAAAIKLAGDDGWQITYQSSTPSWASYSGSRNGQVLYARDIALCDGTAYASFWLTYPERDIAKMNAVINRLAGTLKPAPGDAC